MRTISATDLAIALAAREENLRLVARTSRFGAPFVAIEDQFGVICVAADQDEAAAIVSRVLQVTAAPDFSGAIVRLRAGISQAQA